MNVDRSVISPVLVDRDDLLGLSVRRIAEVRAGSGRVLLLAGEAGIGKTRLLGAIERSAVAEGFRAPRCQLSGRSARGRRHPPGPRARDADVR